VQKQVEVCPVAVSQSAFRCFIEWNRTAELLGRPLGGRVNGDVEADGMAAMHSLFNPRSDRLNEAEPTGETRVAEQPHPLMVM
jgi:hypothetical protein